MKTYVIVRPRHCWFNCARRWLDPDARSAEGSNQRLAQLNQQWRGLNYLNQCLTLLIEAFIHKMILTFFRFSNHVKIIVLCFELLSLSLVDRCTKVLPFRLYEIEVKGTTVEWGTVYQFHSTDTCQCHHLQPLLSSMHIRQASVVFFSLGRTWERLYIYPMCTILLTFKLG